jgi:hypothetical protein
MVAVLFVSAFIAANSNQASCHLPPAQARVVDRWLKSHAGYRVATDDDCEDCATNIAALRRGSGGPWKPVPNYHPYCVEGDFNGDKNRDLAIVVVAPTKAAERFVLLVFNGPFTSPGTHSPAFVSEPMDLKHSGLAYGPPRPRPYRLLIGEFESEGILLIPKGKGYEWDQTVDD